MVKNIIKKFTEVIFGKDEPTSCPTMLAPLPRLEFKPIERPVYILKLNSTLSSEDAWKVRQEISRQLEEGLLLLNHSVSFVGRKIEICGHTVTVEFVDERVTKDDELSQFKPFTQKDLNIAPFTVNGAELLAQVIAETIRCKEFPTLPRNIETIHAKVTELYLKHFECFGGRFYTKTFNNYDDLYSWLKENLISIPEIEELNLRQREYDEGLRAKDVHGERPTFPRQNDHSPDEDFIDLNALCQNIAFNLTHGQQCVQK